MLFCRILNLFQRKIFTEKIGKILWPLWGVLVQYKHLYVHNSRLREVHFCFQNPIVIWVVAEWASALDSSSGVSDQQSLCSSPGLDTCVRLGACNVNHARNTKTNHFFFNLPSSLTLISQHTGPTALFPIRRTKQ